MTFLAVNVRARVSDASVMRCGRISTWQLG